MSSTITSKSGTGSEDCGRDEDPTRLNSVTEIHDPRDSDDSWENIDELTELGICTCTYEKDMTPENKLQLLRLDIKIMNKFVLMSMTPRASIVEDVVEILRTAFETDSPCDVCFRLKTWAQSRVMEGILDSVDGILVNAKPMRNWRVYLESLDSLLDTLGNFVAAIFKMLETKRANNEYFDYESGYNELKEDLYMHINGVRFSNFRVGILTGKFPLASLPKLAGVESIADLLPKDRNEECAVCKNIELSPDVNFGILSSCNHVFCASCLERVFEWSSKCPICRVESVFWLSRDQFFKLKSPQNEILDQPRFLQYE